MTPQPAHHHDHPDHRGDELDDHDRGLAFDLPRLMGRRRALQVFGAAGGALALAACGSSNGSSAGTTAAAATGATAGTAGTTAATGTTASTATGTAATAVGDVQVIPEETAGPYPADGSNGPNVLTEAGVVRSDIRSSFGTASGVAEGVVTTISFTVVDAATDTPLPGAAVYAWHCDREGRYSIYSEGAEDENYLRGVQEADADGVATFTTIYPGCYSGRWPHVHFEVYPSLAEATAAGSILATSQIALPEEVSTAVYATEGYEDSVRNAAQVSLQSDNVFRDGWELETPTTAGSVEDGLTVVLTVGVGT